jgi:filamentous hemagglutinin family protein
MITILRSFDRRVGVQIGSLICTCRAGRLVLVLLALPFSLTSAWPAPAGPTVTQGSASFASQGSQLTITTSDRAFINWQSFNIGLGETTTFVEPSASSVVWNQINNPNPSQILGTLNANGFLVLQSAAGFYIGGQAAISAPGLLMTTAPIRVPDLAGGGAWQFNAPPPTASIINYGQINIGSGGSAYLIAHGIENYGAISAPQGQIGLYAGKEVLVSERPDGRGLSAKVTLPEGSVDNYGRLTADAGSLVLQAQVVNQGGLIQANSVRENNGVIELLASDSINLGPNSLIQAQGEGQGASPGGNVLIKSGGQFSDETGSTIVVAGGSQGGNGGQAEISALQMSGIHSQIDGHANAGFLGGKLTIDPENIVLSNSGDNAPSSGTVNPGDPPSAGSPDTLTLNVNSFNTLISQSGLSQISLQATRNIEVSALWTLPDSQTPGAALTLTAARNITLDDGSGISAGKNWNVSLVAGTELTSASGRQPGLDGIYLNGDSFIQTLNGNISLWAANEVIVNPGPPYANNTGAVGDNGIRTLNGGNIEVTALYGDVNTGGNYHGYLFGQHNAPYYHVSQDVGGISTVAGGNVSITAGGNVTSYLPVQNNYNDALYDGGSGAFGPEPGNVTITAGGNVSGHYALANGVGTVTAGGNVGAPTAAGGFALSLVSGSWSVMAPNGSIYVQDVNNPNGVFNDHGGSVDAYAGYHLFDYSPQASLLLDAGNAVEITGAGAPHFSPSSPDSPVPFLFPPTLTVIAGAGGFTLDTDVTLFPSPAGNLHITTLNGGNFQSQPNPADPQDVTVYTLSMSDSAAKQWNPFPSSGTYGSFGLTDHSATPPELNNPEPVEINVSGSINNVNIRTTKETTITVAGDMFNAGFLGENLHAGDTTSITVGGNIYYSPIYAFAQLTQAIVGADPLLPSAWDGIFSFLVNPALTASFQVPANATPAQLLADAGALLAFNPSQAAFGSYSPSANPGFVYDPASRQLGFEFQMSQTVRSVLEGTLETIQLNQQGVPVVQPGQASLGQDPAKLYFATTPVTFAPPAVIESLYNQSLNSVRDADSISPGFQIGGPGKFDITASSIDLGSSSGIISWGIGSGNNPVNYASLASVTPAGAGAAVKVTTLSGDLSLLTSTIASIDGGNVAVNSAGAINLSLGDFALIPPNPTAVSYGIFTSGHSDVDVTAVGDINIGGARIATFNGGNVFVTSTQGDVNAGNGANSTLVIPVIYLDPGTGLLTSGTIENPKPFGSGILAVSPTSDWLAPGAGPLPGNITVETPRGSIISTLGGIQQYALNGSIAGGPTITLDAGTPPSSGSAGYPGNVDLGNGGVIGGTINIAAQGTVSGLIISRQNSDIQAAQSFSGTLLSGGTASVSASAGGISGTIVGIGGVSASGGGPITASLLGQNVSVGGAAAQSTLGTTATATTTSQAAAQQASSDAEKQVAPDDTASSDDQKRKRAAKLPTLTKRVGRVTVLLPGQ